MTSEGTFAQVPGLGLTPVGLWLPLVITGKSLPVKGLWLPEGQAAFVGAQPCAGPQAHSVAPGLPGVSCRGMAPGSVFPCPDWWPF